MIIKKKKKNYILPNPKDVVGYKCYICKRPATCQHHLIYGRGKRRISDREKLTIAICDKCHYKIHNHHIKDAELKEMAQNTWLKYNNNNRERWYKMFYKFFDRQKSNRKSKVELKTF